MEGDNLRNWGYYYDSYNSLKALDTHNSMKALNFFSGDRKSIIGGHEAFISSSNGRFHREYGSPTPHFHPSEYNLSDASLLRDNKFFNVLPAGYHSYAVPTETPQTNHHHPMHMLRQIDISNEEKMVRAESSSADIDCGPLKKRSAGKSENPPKTKKQKKASSIPKDGGSGSAQRAKSAKKTIEVVINGIDMDISSLPIPVCSCTGETQQCYRWGFGGWQSACCTTGMSIYPLPMSTKRRGARIAGRKMSLGAFKKVLEKLAAEGYNFSNPIDLRTHWAKHGTNKFVTIR